jgi:Spy/CpxP family protein refolding chaperone
MKKVKYIFVVGAVFLLIAMPASKSYAQHMGHGWRRDKDLHAKNLENLRLLKLLELLDLNEQQDTKFISVFVSFRKEVNEISENIEDEIDSLVDILHQPEPSEGKIMTQILKIEKMKIQRENIVVDFHKEISNVLTPVQLGKMVVFEEHFERELIESVRGFRNRVAPPMPDQNEVPGQ